MNADLLLLEVLEEFSSLTSEHRAIAEAGSTVSAARLREFASALERFRFKLRRLRGLLSAAGEHEGAAGQEEDVPAATAATRVLVH